MSGGKKSPFRSLLIGLGSLLVLAACNYPGLRTPPIQPSTQQLRQTLDAITKLSSTETALSTIATPGTPATAEAAFPTPAPEITPIVNAERYQYFARSGDTIPALSARFGVDPQLILSASLLPERGLIPAGTEIWISNQEGPGAFPDGLLADSAVVYSPAALGFDLAAFIDQQSGYLSSYTETVQGERLTGAQIIERVSVESSVNPRLMLALLEYCSGWVRGGPFPGSDRKYPLGFRVSGWEGLYKEMVIAATHLNAGYYGWRTGGLLRLDFRDGSSAELDPRLNAGSVAVQNVLSKLIDQGKFRESVYGDGGMLSAYRQLFGDPWKPPSSAEPLLPNDLAQPPLELPFAPGLRWSLTGGPHPSWKTGSPRGALDLAPVTGEPACAVSSAWVTAPAAGVVARSARNVVALDLDGDGFEQTGWVLIFMHIADRERVGAGARLGLDDHIGHPSCEGGTSTGTHFHFARKYNGEWIAADGPLPFDLDGWVAYAASRNYYGGLIKGEKEVMASPVGPRTSIIVRE